MQIFNISFPFRNQNRIANVQFSEATSSYTIYFTDVELVLEFGSKAEYIKAKGLELLKSGNDSELLKTAIIRQLEDFPLAA
jgi:hypothetical protein